MAVESFFPPRILMAVCAAFLSAATPSYAQEDSPLPILVRMIHRDHLPVRSVQVEGEYAGQKVVVETSLSDSDEEQMLAIRISIESEDPIHADIPATTLPAIDLAAGNYHARDFDGRLEIIFEYPFGEGNDCFLNDDGRSHLVVILREDGTISARADEYQDCEPVERQILGPAAD